MILNIQDDHSSLSRYAVGRSPESDRSCAFEKKNVSVCKRIYLVVCYIHMCMYVCACEYLKVCLEMCTDEK